MEMTAGRRRARQREVVREVARFWTIPAYVAFGFGLAHFDTRAPWWGLVLLTLVLGTVAIAGVWMALWGTAAAMHSLWRTHGYTYPPDWLSRLLDRPVGYEEYMRWVSETRLRRLQDEIRNLPSQECDELLSVLRDDEREDR